MIRNTINSLLKYKSTAMKYLTLLTISTSARPFKRVILTDLNDLVSISSWLPWVDKTNFGYFKDWLATQTMNQKQFFLVIVIWKKNLPFSSHFATLCSESSMHVLILTQFLKYFTILSHFTLNSCHPTLTYLLWSGCKLRITSYQYNTR